MCVHDLQDRTSANKLIRGETINYLGHVLCCWWQSAWRRGKAVVKTTRRRYDRRASETHAGTPIVPDRRNDITPANRDESKSLANRSEPASCEIDSKILVPIAYSSK